VVVKRANSDVRNRIGIVVNWTGSRVD